MKYLAVSHTILQTETEQNTQYFNLNQNRTHNTSIRNRTEHTMLQSETEQSTQYFKPEQNRTEHRIFQSETKQNIQYFNLKQNRTAVKAKVAHIKKYIESLPDTVDMYDVNVRLQLMEKMWDEYNAVQDQLECNDDDESNSMS